MYTEDKDKPCHQCGHKHSEHEATEEGIGECHMIIENGKAIFKCICQGDE